MVDIKAEEQLDQLFEKNILVDPNHKKPLLQLIEKGIIKEEDIKNIRQLGDGGFGCVYKISDDKVIKITDKENGSNSKDVNNSLSNAGAYITKVLESITIENYKIEVFKKRLASLDKLPLFPKYKKDETVTENKNKDAVEETLEGKYTAISIFAQCLLGLKNIINSNVIHNDIKFLNIMIDENGDVSYIDFNISRKLDVKQPVDIKGGNNYAIEAPELNFNKTYGDNTIYKKSDIYTLGFIILQMFMDENIFNFIERVTGVDKNSNKFLKRITINDNLEKIQEAITLEIINLDKAFPNNHFTDIQKKEITKQLYDMFKGMSKIELEDRFDIEQLENHFVNFLEYLESIGLDLKNDLKLKDKDLYEFEIFDKVNDEYIEGKKDSILKYNKILLEEDEKEWEQLTTKEKNHILTITGKEKPNLSEKTKDCLKSLQNCFYSDKNNLFEVNNEKLKKFKEEFKNYSEDLEQVKKEKIENYNKLMKFNEKIENYNNKSIELGEKIENYNEERKIFENYMLVNEENSKEEEDVEQSEKYLQEDIEKIEKYLQEEECSLNKESEQLYELRNQLEEESEQLKEKYFSEEEECSEMEREYMIVDKIQKDCEKLARAMSEKKYTTNKMSQFYKNDMQSDPDLKMSSSSEDEGLRLDVIGLEQNSKKSHNNEDKLENAELEIKKIKINDISNSFMEPVKEKDNIQKK